MKPFWRVKWQADGANAVGLEAARVGRAGTEKGQCGKCQAGNETADPSFVALHFWDSRPGANNCSHEWPADWRWHLTTGPWVHTEEAAHCSKMNPDWIHICWSELRRTGLFTGWFLHESPFFISTNMKI